MTPLLLTVKGAALASGIPIPTIYKLIADGKLAEVRIPGADRRVWIRAADLEKLIERARRLRQ